jgi:anti-anti-sigma factor
MVSTERRAEAWLVNLTCPELDSVASEQLLGELDRLADEVGAGAVVLDMSKISFLQSTALGALIAFRNRLKGLGGRVVLASPAPRIRRTLVITRLDVLFGLYDDVDQALIALVES